MGHEPLNFTAQNPLADIAITMGVVWVILNGFAYMKGGPKSMGSLNAWGLKMLRKMLGGIFKGIGKLIAGK